MCNLQEHIERDIRARQQETAEKETSPTIEWVKERPVHPVHIPEHLRGIVAVPTKEEQ